MESIVNSTFLFFISIYMQRFEDSFSLMSIFFNKMASVIGFEPTADRLGGDSSILLRYTDNIFQLYFNYC